MTSKFVPGFYRMRNGEKAEVFAERDGLLYGRILNKNGDWLQWNWSVSGQDFTGERTDLISPWAEERKPFECWVNRHPGGWPQVKAHPTEEAADEHAEGSKRFGPALHMIESTPLALAAGDLYEALDEIVSEWGYPNTSKARAALAKAKP